jgi:hypothetical protein
MLGNGAQMKDGDYGLEGFGGRALGGVSVCRTRI